MSIKLMSAIFETEMRELPYEKDGEPRNAKASTAKLVLLAIADHANDYGEGSYPGFDRLQRKTGLSRGGLSDTIEALKQNGLLLVDKRGSRFGTNDYTVNIRAFPPMYKESEDLPELVYPVDSQESSDKTQKSLPSGLKSSVKPLEEPNKPTLKERRAQAKERTAKQRAERGSRDPVLEIAKTSQEFQAVSAMRLRVEAAVDLNLEREWDLPKSDWNGYEKKLLKREQETGQTIEQFMAWYNADEFRRNGNIWLKPSKIEQMWNRAFGSNGNKQAAYAYDNRHPL